MGCEPGLEGLFRPAFNHRQQSAGPVANADRGEVDDHGDVLVPAAGVTPHVLIRPDHIVESAGFVGQQPVSFGQEGIVGGVSGNTMPSSDAVHGQVVVHERFRRPSQRARGQARARLRRARQVLAPDMSAAGADSGADGPAGW